MNIGENTATPIAVADDAVVSDASIIRQAIVAELDAISLYEQMAASTSNSRLKKALLDISLEEKVHVGELEALLAEVDDEYEGAIDDGASEVNESEEKPDYLEIQLSSCAEDGEPVSTVMKHRFSSGGEWEYDSDLDSGEQAGAREIPQQVADLLDGFGLPVGKLNDQGYAEGEIKMGKPISEKSASKAQQRLFGMVHKYKEEGGPAPDKVKKIAKGISGSDTKDFAKTKHKGLPEKVEQESFERRLDLALKIID